MSKLFIQYGAGNIGRGFIGQLFSQGGYRVGFIDVNTDIINRLNTDKKYTVTILDNDIKEEIVLYNVYGIDGRDNSAVAEAIASADCMATAIGVNILPYIAPNIAAGIKLRYQRGITSPLDIIICENLIDADKYLSQLICKQLDEKETGYFTEHIGLVKASIGRMVPVLTAEQIKSNPTNVFAERYCKLPVDKDAFKGSIPDIPGIYPFSPFGYFIKRKLYIHNMGHSLTAYLGGLSGYKYIWEAIDDSRIKYVVLRAMLESAGALSSEYDMPLRDLLLHIYDLMRRFSNHALEDTVDRVGKDIKRKLSENDRFIGALKYCLSMGIKPVHIPAGVAAGLLFRAQKDDNSGELIKELEEKGVVYVLENFCGLSDNETYLNMITEYYKQLTDSFDMEKFIYNLDERYGKINRESDIL